MSNQIQSLSSPAADAAGAAPSLPDHSQHDDEVRRRIHSAVEINPNQSQTTRHLAKLQLDLREASRVAVLRAVLPTVVDDLVIKKSFRNQLAQGKIPQRTVTLGKGKNRTKRQFPATRDRRWVAIYVASRLLEDCSDAYSPVTGFTPPSAEQLRVWSADLVQWLKAVEHSHTRLGRPSRKQAPATAPRAQPPQRPAQPPSRPSAGHLALAAETPAAHLPADAAQREQTLKDAITLRLRQDWSEVRETLGSDGHRTPTAAQLDRWWHDLARLCFYDRGRDLLLAHWFEPAKPAPSTPVGVALRALAARVRSFGWTADLEDFRRLELALLLTELAGTLDRKTPCMGPDLPLPPTLQRICSPEALDLDNAGQRSEHATG